MTADTCIFCGEIIPEGRMVCRRCELDAEKRNVKNKRRCTMTNEEILNSIERYSIPYKWQEKEPFRKYGIEIDGVYPEWVWFTEENITDTGRKNGRVPISQATREELLEMLAICAMDSADLYKSIVRRVEKAGIEWHRLPDVE